MNHETCWWLTCEYLFVLLDNVKKYFKCKNQVAEIIFCFLGKSFLYVRSRNGEFRCRRYEIKADLWNLFASIFLVLSEKFFFPIFFLSVNFLSVWWWYVRMFVFSFRFFSPRFFFLSSFISLSDVWRCHAGTKKKEEEKTKEKIGKSEGSLTQHACVLACASTSVHARSVSSNACELRRWDREMRRQQVLRTSTLL